MNNAIKLMLKRYDCRTLQEHEQALREILQEIALIGLWRAKFFEHAAFYGGTALRIFYALDRFSEDLDFTLLQPDIKWNWDTYGEAVKNELSSYGFDVNFYEKEKKSQSSIKSAFLKTPTVQELLKIGVHTDLLKGFHRETLIRIKVEIDTNPTIDFSYEQKFLEQPISVPIRCVNEESLFACKLHAAFYRTWKGRVKGRDWYDVIWFIRKNTALDLGLFSKLIGKKEGMDRDSLLDLAKERIDQLNIQAAVEDILFFVRDQEAIQRTWSKEFFLHWFNSIKIKSPGEDSSILS